MIKIFRAVLISLFLFFVLLNFSLVMAHGLGQTIRKEKEGYFVEFEYEAFELTNEEPIEYAFRLIEKEENKNAEFEVVNVRVVEKSKNVGVFSGNINAQGAFQLGPRVYLKLDPGDYSFKLSFIKGEERLVDESFDIKVLKGDSKKELIVGAGGFLAGVVLAVAAMFLYIKKSLKKKDGK